MAPVASAAPALPTGRHYLIDVATGEATDTATGEVLKPAAAATTSGTAGQVSEA